MYKVVHYINQFYAGIGGEEKADFKPEVRAGFLGPGTGLNGLLKDKAEIVATVICGDSYFSENMDEARKTILEMIKNYSPDIFVAGPAFNAGRYGVACGSIAKAVKEELHIPVVSAMYPENPGADMYKRDIYIVETKNSAAGMRNALSKMSSLMVKLLNKEDVSPRADGYIDRGIRKNFFAQERGAKRAVDMLVKILHNKIPESEFTMPVFDRVAPNPPVKDLKRAKIALVTSGGIVPKGNPDHIESSSASKYGKYDIGSVSKLGFEGYETAHGGYDPTYANQDADRVLPVDVLRAMEKRGDISSLFRYYYSTVGNGTAVGTAKRFGEEIVKELVENGVDAVIVTST